MFSIHIVSGGGDGFDDDNDNDNIRSFKSM